jgi:hypothetical protein
VASLRPRHRRSPRAERCWRYPREGVSCSSSFLVVCVMGAEASYLVRTTGDRIVNAARGQCAKMGCSAESERGKRLRRPTLRPRRCSESGQKTATVGPTRRSSWSSTRGRRPDPSLREGEDRTTSIVSGRCDFRRALDTVRERGLAHTSAKCNLANGRPIV